MARDPEAPEILAAFADVLDEVAVAGDVERCKWFGTPAAKVEGRIFVAIWRGRLVARIGADEVDARIAAGGGERFDPSGKGMGMKDWLDAAAEPDEWMELALSAIAFTAGEQPG